jgi:hypothetical protein
MRALQEPGVLLRVGPEFFKWTPLRSSVLTHWKEIRNFFFYTPDDCDSFERGWIIFPMQYIYVLKLIRKITLAWKDKIKR